MLKKYKDLTIAQQLHINAQAVKLAAGKLLQNELNSKCQEMQERISQYQNKFAISKNLEEQARQKQQ